MEQGNKLLLLLRFDNKNGWLQVLISLGLPPGIQAAPHDLPLPCVHKPESALHRSHSSRDRPIRSNQTETSDLTLFQSESVCNASVALTSSALSSVCTWFVTKSPPSLLDGRVSLAPKIFVGASTAAVRWKRSKTAADKNLSFVYKTNNNMQYGQISSSIDRKTLCFAPFLQTTFCHKSDC